MSPSPSSDPIRHQAVDWLVRQHSGAFNVAERQQFERWLAIPEHRKVFERVAAAWSDLPYPGNEVRAARQKKRRFAPRLHTLAYAASLVMVVGLCWQEGWPLNDESVWRTAKGELKTLVLSDGSRVELNSDSELVVRYGWRRRTLELRRGEALFDVAGLKWRPFEVHADGALLRDIGTRFDVALTKSGASLAVLEGTVELNIAATGEHRRADGGQSLSYNANTVLSEPAAIDTQTAVAWREHKMIFRNTPLADVLDELERYQPVNFKIADPGVARMRLGGVFDNDDLERFLTTLKLVLPVTVRPDKNGNLLVERRN